MDTTGPSRFLIGVVDHSRLAFAQREGKFEFSRSFSSDVQSRRYCAACGTSCWDTRVYVDRVDLRDIVVTGPRDVRLDGLVATLIGEEETKLGVAEITL